MQSGGDLPRTKINYFDSCDRRPRGRKGCLALADGLVPNDLLRLRCCGSRNLTDAFTVARDVGAILLHVTPGDVLIPVLKRKCASHAAIASDVSNRDQRQGEAIGSPGGVLGALSAASEPPSRDGRDTRTAPSGAVDSSSSSTPAACSRLPRASADEAMINTGRRADPRR